LGSRSGILFLLTFAVIYFLLPLIFLPCLFFGSLFLAIRHRIRILSGAFVTVFLVFFSASIWSSFSVSNFKILHEEMLVGYLEHVKSVRLVLPENQNSPSIYDLACGDFCMQLLDRGHFDNVIIESGHNFRKTYKLGRGVECLPQLTSPYYGRSITERNNSWALSPTQVNYTHRLDFCAIPIPNDGKYQASIYLDKMPEVAPWIKIKGHSIIITEGQDTQENIISEAYQISFTYPAPIIFPFIRCVPVSNGSLSLACAKREFTFINTETILYQQNIEHVIANTFRMPPDTTQSPDEGMPGYDDIKSMLQADIQRGDSCAASATILPYAKQNIFFPNETRDFFLSCSIVFEILEQARQSNGADAKTILRESIPILVNKISAARHAPNGPDLYGSCSLIGALSELYAGHTAELKDYFNVITDHLSYYVETCSQVSSNDQDVIRFRAELVGNQSQPDIARMKSLPVASTYNNIFGQENRKLVRLAISDLMAIKFVDDKIFSSLIPDMSALITEGPPDLVNCATFLMLERGHKDEVLQSLHSRADRMQEGICEVGLTFATRGLPSTSSRCRSYYDHLLETIKAEKMSENPSITQLEEACKLP
jgi:hypothetical protein